MTAEQYSSIMIAIPPEGNPVKVLPYLNQLLPVIRTQAHPTLIVYMGGYDDDPRELYEIDEARASWVLTRSWLVEQDLLDYTDAESHGLLDVCWAIAQGWTIYNAIDERNHIVIERDLTLDT